MHEFAAFTDVYVQDRLSTVGKTSMFADRTSLSASPAFHSSSAFSLVKSRLTFPHPSRNISRP